MVRDTGTFRETATSPSLEVEVYPRRISGEKLKLSHSDLLFFDNRANVGFETLQSTSDIASSTQPLPPILLPIVDCFKSLKVGPLSPALVNILGAFAPFQKK